MDKQEKVIIYYFYMNIIGGIETWIYNFCQQMKDNYDITVITCGDINQLKRLCEIVDVEIYDANRKYECDVLINNHSWAKTPSNIIFKKNIKVIHANYTELRNPDLKIIQDADEYVAVSKSAAEASLKAFGIKCLVINPFLLNKKELNHGLKLISLTRATSEKGIDRIYKLAELFNSAGIVFKWDIYSNIKPEIIPKGITICEPKLKTTQELYDSDYLVQLSDTESFCYSVHEALQCGVPVIVTDIKAFKDVIVDGYNGYKLPLDMENIDVRKIYENIPKEFVYDEENDLKKKSWYNLIGKPVYVKRDRYSEDVEILIKMDYMDLLLNKYITKGTVLKVNKVRAAELCFDTPERPAIAVYVR